MKIEQARITVTFEDPDELLYAMTDEEQVHFLEALSSQDAVIQYVLEQVFEGYTRENFYSGSEICAWNGSTPLQKFRNRLIEVGADYTTKKRIESLERYCEWKDKRIQELETELDKFK